MKILRKAADMKAIDKASMSEPYGIAPAVLMEKAGRAVGEKGGVYVGGWSGKDVMILCGKGNNGDLTKVAFLLFTLQVRRD